MLAQLDHGELCFLTFSRLPGNTSEYMEVCVRAYIIEFTVDDEPRGKKPKLSVTYIPATNHAISCKTSLAACQQLQRQLQLQLQPSKPPKPSALMVPLSTRSPRTREKSRGSRWETGDFRIIMNIVMKKSNLKALWRWNFLRTVHAKGGLRASRALECSECFQLQASSFIDRVGYWPSRAQEGWEATRTETER